uniref:Transcription factor IIIC subunit 5 HTH domain-containing protein n=1 Tax=Tetradesmus obliquus TaxID=3088 RepID=A0A383W949_TETOB|eukprot:jgi/Sobl393_1/15836/SZX73639.1
MSAAPGQPRQRQQQQDAADEADALETLDVKVPRQSGVAIHLPGFISSVDSALQTLGGEAALEKALQDNALLKLRLRPEDPASHPLFGERLEHPGLVLRIARPKGQPDAAPRISVVCRTHASYAFTGLADYQYLGQDHGQAARDLSRLSARNQPAAAEPLRAPQPLLLLPPIFSKQDMPVAFAFRDSAPPKGAASLEKDSSGQCSGQRQPQQQRLQRHHQQQPKRAASGLDPSSHSSHGSICSVISSSPPKEADVEQQQAASARKRVISFYEPQLPPELPLPAGAGQGPEQQQQLARLKELLAQRPAWPLELLLAAMPGASEASLAPALQALCYQFKTGPWKGLFISCSFDPRASLEGRPYQMLAYRLPTEWSKAVKAAKAAGRPLQQPTMQQLTSFTAMPLAHTTYLQLTDLAESDAAISQLVAGAPLPASTPSEAYGWFTFSSSQQLQQALSMAFSSIHRQQLGELQEQLARMPQQQDGQEAAAMDTDQQPAAPLPASKLSRRQRQMQRQQAERAARDAAAGGQQQQQDGEQQQQQALDGLVSGMLGLEAPSGQQDELQAWLAEEAAAAEERRQRRAAAAAAAEGGGGEAGEASGLSGTDGGESTDAGLSEADSDWATSGGETSGGDDGDDDERGGGSSDYDAAGAGGEELDEYEQYNQDV